MADLLPEIQRAICEFVRDSPQNRHEGVEGPPIFDAPLVGVADGDDPLFAEYRTIIGAFHVTPREAIEYTATVATRAVSHPSLDRLSVVCWALPITKETRMSNRREARVPSRRWAHTRWFGEQLNDALRRHVVEMFEGMGYLAIAPMMSSLFKTFNEGIVRPPASTWSERHILYAAGLGTFSLNDGFITPRGMAMRCGSVVANMALTPSPRPYSNHLANCLFYRDGSCRRCIARCPVGAIGEQGHDKQKCQSYSYGELKPVRDEYGVGVTGCGLCQTRVPCEDRIPTSAKARNR